MSVTADQRHLMWIGLAALRWQNQHLKERNRLTIGDLAIERQYKDWCDAEEAAASKPTGPQGEKP
jgi:hypothetical protein